MSKQKLFSIRMEEKLFTKLARQAQRGGYKTVSEYSRYLLQESGNPLVRQREREQLARLICKIQTRIEYNGISDPELREELEKIKGMIY